LTRRYKTLLAERERPGRTWRFGAACFDAVALRLTVGGVVVELEPRPLELLGLLLEHAGEVVTKDEILDALWPDRTVTEASLTKCVARLRAALGEGEQAAIRTVHGYGYRFDATVTIEETVPAGAAPVATGPVAVAGEPGDPVPMRPNWRLVRRLGAGGYGDVWLGEQTKSRERRVFKFAMDAAGLAGLRREITLGRLLREGLGPREDFARILDWNLEQPPYFIETDFSPDGSLADWCDAEGGAGAVAMEVRLELAAQIADALSAAHGMGVLHKDIKPGNVLIRRDSAGRPAIALTDFGSGRALDPSRLDAFGITRLMTEEMSDGATSGTALYRAPELLAGGTPTVQADIYALGILLFQLVAGDLRLPLAPGWEARVADPLLREDIGLAAAGDPALRLRDAAELGRRLRTLPARRAAAEAAAEAEAAAARTRQELALARARRGPLIGLAVALTAGLAASIFLYARAERAAADARMEAARATAVTAFVTDDLLSFANPLLASDPDVPVKTLLGAAADGLDRRFAPGSPERAAIETVIGSAYVGLGEAAPAKSLLEAALASRRKQLGDGAAETQAVRLALGALYENEVDLVALRRVAQDILDAGKAAGVLDPQTEINARYLVALASCEIAGSSEGCVAPLRPLLDEARRRIGAGADLTLKIQSKLAYSLGAANRFDEAVPMAREALALTQESHGPHHLLVLDRKFHLAEALDETGQGEEAVRLLTEVRDAALALSGHETELSARAASQLGFAYSNMKRYDDAARNVQLALDYNIKAHGEMFPISREALNSLANIYAFAGREQEAVATGEKALALERAALGPDHQDTIWFENNLADYYHRAGRMADAEATYRDVVARAGRAFTHGEWDTAHFEFHLGQVLAEEGKIAEARTLLTDSVAQLSAKLGPSHPRTERARAALAALDGK
jgi:non-specific serine/threonine protein kinase